MVLLHSMGYFELIFYTAEDKVQNSKLTFAKRKCTFILRAPVKCSPYPDSGPAFCHKWPHSQDLVRTRAAYDAVNIC